MSWQCTFHGEEMSEPMETREQAELAAQAWLNENINDREFLDVCVWELDWIYKDTIKLQPR